MPDLQPTEPSGAAIPALLDAAPASDAMPEMQPSVPGSPATVPVLIEAPASLRDDTDYALGCECADPALQIERWNEAPAGDAA